MIVQTCEAIDARVNLGCNVYACQAAPVDAIRVGGGDERSTSTSEIRLCLVHSERLAASLASRRLARGNA